MAALIAVALVALLLLGVPLFVVIALTALAGFVASAIDPTVLMVEFYRLADMPVLVAIPLFTFAGYLLSESQAPKRLVALSDALLGFVPGGLAIVSLVLCALFTAFTGASGVTILALGALLYPALREAGYDEHFSLGLVTISGSLGLLFAPSLPLILWGLVAQQLDVGPPTRIDELFLAGLLPGLLMLLILAAYAVHVGRRLPPRPGRGGFDGARLRNALWDARYELPLPLIVLGGIYGGFVAASEAASVTALYVFAIVMLIRRELPWSQLPAVMRSSTLLVGAILLILGVSLALGNVMIDNEIPARVLAFVQAHIDHPLVFLLVLNVFLLVLGMLLDIFAAIVLMAPLLIPVALGFGIDPVHLGIIFLANLQLGYFTPPVGMNLFIASFRFDKPVSTLARAAWPFFLLLLAAVLIITYVPALSLGLLDRPPIAVSVN